MILVDIFYDSLDNEPVAGSIEGINKSTEILKNILIYTNLMGMLLQYTHEVIL